MLSLPHINFFIINGLGITGAPPLELHPARHISPAAPIGVRAQEGAQKEQEEAVVEGTEAQLQVQGDRHIWAVDITHLQRRQLLQNDPRCHSVPARSADNDRLHHLPVGQLRAKRGPPGEQAELHAGPRWGGVSQAQEVRVRDRHIDWEGDRPQLRLLLDQVGEL
ncbi:hypothetical protein FGO68_gene12594 [Halteria grandinella]|uniref:Uncharacterized protein n=1 Tax=Halteria grandinella TaxID=5974 RepID=A0A8J8T7G6_HALGN|nr:hypothetical protein FGO68_gene12594 [Halteria grandinella]